MTNKRDLRLDLIRAIAVFCVLSVHFFLNNYFYDTVVAGKRMYVMSLMRTAFCVCVPLFLLLTGYLCCHKTLTRKYYGGIRHTLELYFLISVECLLFARFYLKEDYPLLKMLLRIPDFYACTYAWYIEMYIGLFLLIPFLNILWNNLYTQRKKKLLVATCLILTTLPSVTNNIDFMTPTFWSRPSTATWFYPLLPDWWISFYPVTYYFIGAYIREYDIRIPMGKNLALLLLCIVLFGNFNYYWNYDSTFAWSSFNAWYGYQNVIDSVLVFLLILHLDLSHCPKPIAVIITRVSQLSLGIYLASSISDKLVYPILNERVPDMTMRLNYYPVVVAATFLMAMVLSQISHWLLIPIDHALDACVKKLRRREIPTDSGQ